MTEALTEFNQLYTYKKDRKWFDTWRVLSAPGIKKGDCDDYAVTVAWLCSGKTTSGLLRGIITRRYKFHFVTLANASHLVLELDGLYIDNIVQRWRPKKEMSHVVDWKFVVPWPLVLVKLFLGVFV